MKKERSKIGSAGFTLVELLVVISIIAMLLSILMPTLSKAREQAKRIDCQSNLKQLTLAWNMYAMSNNDRLCSPSAGDKAEGTWADIFNEEKGMVSGSELSIKSSALWPYTQSIKVYGCKSAPLNPRFREFAKRLRDYSMSRIMGYPTLNSGWEENITVNRFTTLSSIQLASNRLVLIDGEGGGVKWESQLESYMNIPYIADAFWPILRRESGDTIWKFRRDKDSRPPHIITARHDNGFNLSFADGHCGYYKYKDKRTIQLCNEWTEKLEIEASVDNPDLDYMVEILRGPE